nr:MULTISPECIES: FtsW/RodA/SpoVE family cell cycle protein [unclassified Nitratiruptor]
MHEKSSSMIGIDRRIFLHFDTVLLVLIIPFLIISHYLIKDVNPVLAHKQMIYYALGFASFVIAFLSPIREYKWLIPSMYWFMIVLLISVDLFGVSKLGAKRWLEIPFTHFTLQPSELFKPAFILMLAYLVQNNPPPKSGYGWKEFFKISFYILFPFLLIAKEPDLGTALILLIIGYGVLFIIGVHWKIWATLFIIFSFMVPISYQYLLHDYQKKRIEDFLSEKPSYHVQQSIIAIGSGGLTGKPSQEATQTQLKFLPIATSDFIFAYFIERFGFFGALLLLFLYGLLILHLFSIYVKLKGDFFTQVVAASIALLIFTYMSVNIAMTVGLAPVVGVPLPFMSYGGSSFINFMILFGILEHLLAFRFRFLYNSRQL